MTERERRELKRLLSSGMSLREVGASMGRSASWVRDQVRDMRRNGELLWFRPPITLPEISFGKTDIRLEPAHYYAGRQAMREAGI